MPELTNEDAIEISKRQLYETHNGYNCFNNLSDSWAAWRRVLHLAECWEKLRALCGSESAYSRWLESWMNDFESPPARKSTADELREALNELVEFAKERPCGFAGGPIVSRDYDLINKIDELRKRLGVNP